MPVGLETLKTRFKRLLKEIITISSGIRDSALDYADDQNFDVSERLCHQLEIIRISADAVLQAFAKASVTRHPLDDQIADWLTSGEPQSCLGKLKEMNDLLRPIDCAEDSTPSPTSTEDKLTVAMAFFDDHKSLFRFLLTHDVWNHERLGHLQSEAPQLDAPLVTNDHQGVQITTGHENGPLSLVDQAIVTDHKKEFLRQKLDEISRWLSPMECTQRHRDALRLRQEGTCKWFPNTDVYGKWRAPGNHFLWLHGKAGCGKSVLIASTVEYLKNGLEKEEVVVFFYCDFQNKRSTSSTELMRSLLSQLLRHIRDQGVDPGDFPDKMLQQKSEGTLSLDDLGKLCNLVSRAASFFRYEPMIIIDALDECADIGTLLPTLITLAQNDVRLLVTSRPDWTIVDHFTGLPTLSFEDVTKDISADIALLVKRELDTHSFLRYAIPEMMNEIDSKLTERAEGRFRWAQCQLDTLKRCATREELSEALNSLPNELEATYERILEMIDERKSEGELARRVLALLIVALEPLQLVQIVDGLSMDFQKRQNDHETRQWLETKLLHSLSSLVSYDEETDVLVLSHFSVKQYLTSCLALPMYRIVTHEAHAEVVQMCMGYVSVFLKKDRSGGDVEPLQCFPMLSYVLSSGFNHLSKVDSESFVALEALQSLGSDVRHHPSHWDLLCGFREEILEWPYALWPTSKQDFILYILIAYSPPGLLQTFLSISHPLQLRVRTNPLVYAADLRKTEHAMVLLAHGANVDARGSVVDDSYRASPIEAAIDLGDEVLVEELLQRGCLVTTELLATAVCMPWCRTRVLAKLMKTDEFVEWALEIGEEELYRNVFSSARTNSGDSIKADKDHLVLAQRLRQCGLDLSVESQFREELIRRALHAAHISMLEFLLPPDRPPPAVFLLMASTGDTSETVSVVRFLLQRGVNVHAVSDESGDGALHRAAMCPWEPRSLELTRLLIDAGCNPLALNSEGETSLVVAMTHSHRSVVEFLLTCNVPLPSDILRLALEGPWNSQMIEFLLDKGVDIHAVAQSTGNTLLHCAISESEPDEDCEEEGGDNNRQESQCLGLVKHFLEVGCNPTTRNFSGETALDIAMQRNFISVVELLLSLDVPLPSDALLIAVQSSAPEMVEYLICRGTDTQPTTSDGDTAVHLALSYIYDSEETSRKLVKILTNAGCDKTACNAAGTTALEIAIERDFTSVVELLLSSDVPLPPDALLLAVQGSTLEMVECLIHRGADMHSTTAGGDTVLHLALSCNHSEEMCFKLVEKLTNVGCDPTARNSAGKTPLEIAIKRSFTSVVKLFLSSNIHLPPNAILIALRHGSTLEMVECLIHGGADMHSITSKGDTVLHLTFLRRYGEETCCELVKRLMNAGCDATACNSSGQTVLEIAIKRNFTSVVELLISPDVPLPPNALLIAVQQGSTPEIIERLIHRGADLHSISSSGDTVLHLVLAVSKYSEGMCCELVKKLINAGCNTTAHDSTGRTALGIAIERNLISVIKLLLSVNAPLPLNSLLIAIRRGLALEIVEYLIQKGADVRSVTSNNDTALHLVLTCWNYKEKLRCKLVKILIDAGCDPTARNATGKTALGIALGCNSTSVVKLLLSCNAPLPSDALLIAVQHSRALEVVESLIHGGVDVCSITSNGDTVLHLALTVWRYSEETRCQLVRKLINAGCDATARNFSGETALAIAMRRNFTFVAELLLSPDVPLPPDALLIAVQQGSTLETVECLIRRGADVHCTTSSGDTILHLALIWGPYSEEACFKLAKRLIDIGCNPTACNFDGRTPLEIAIKRSFTSVVELLLSSGVSLPPDALLIATRQGSTLETVERLIHRGADAHSIASSGDTVLHLALIWGPYSEETCYKLVKRLIDIGCDPTACNSDGRTALEIAIERNFTSVVELLLSSGVSLPPDAPLIAIRQGSTFEMVECLVRRGADVRSISANGDTTPHHPPNLVWHYEEAACYVFKLAKGFINVRCNPTVRNSTGKMVLDLAMECKCIPAVNLLLSSNVPISHDVLLIALQRESPPEVIEHLVHRGANVHSTTPSGDTVLHLALYQNYGEEISRGLVERLINAGCNPSMCNSKGDTVVLAAMERSYFSVVELLFSSNILIPPDILHTAIRRHCEPQIIQVLVREGASNCLGIASGSEWDSLLQLAHTSYSGQSSQQIIEILEAAARKSCRARSRSLEDQNHETHMHVAKKPRLEG